MQCRNFLTRLIPTDLSKSSTSTLTCWPRPTFTLSRVPEMIYGSKPTDDGNFLLTSEERDELIKKNPRAEKWIRPFLGSREFIRNIARYCLWLVDCPTKFQAIRQPTRDYILVPRHSSELRRYVPIGYVSSDVICGDANQMIPDAKLFHFGVLTSSVHMTRMRTVAGRLREKFLTCGRNIRRRVLPNCTTKFPCRPICAKLTLKMTRQS